MSGNIDNPGGTAKVQDSQRTGEPPVVVAPAPNLVEAPAPGVSILSAALISAAVSATLLVSGLTLYDKLLKQPPRSIATVDLDALVSARELAMIESLSQPGTTDADRGHAYDQIGAFGSQMEAAVNAATLECGCDILVRGAVVGRPTRDLTDQIAQRLGISPGAVAQGRERIRRTLSAASTSPGVPGLGAADGPVPPQLSVSSAPREPRP